MRAVAAKTFRQIWRFLDCIRHFGENTLHWLWHQSWQWHCNSDNARWGCHWLIYRSLSACSILSSLAAMDLSASLTSFISRSCASLSDTIWDFYTAISVSCRLTLTCIIHTKAATGAISHWIIKRTVSIIRQCHQWFRLPESHPWEMSQFHQ